ncbi:MAG: adenylyltransferase/cytidyltransferase family protein [Phycisphaerales bacterium]|nr:adenylyltransferase/cytidyltransferase family protein [Phycisphaerales bacterium]
MGESRSNTRAGKIVTREQLLAVRADFRREGKTLVHCHGCFDIVHPGHIRHLRFARQQGDALLVSITGDLEMKKGTGRPLIPEELRAENLAELDCVDLVYVESRPTAAELLGEVRPDVYIKGREYETNDDPRFRAEREAVERGGGRVVFSSGDVVFSSTALIAAMERSVDPFHRRLVALTQNPELGAARLYEAIARLRDRRVVVIGETILDTYVACDQPDVAGESPVMTLRPLTRHYYEGGAAIIARHAAALGARATLVTPIGPGEARERVLRRLASEGVDVRPLDVHAPLPEKQRYRVGAQKVMKVDLVEPLVLDEAKQRELLGLCEDAWRPGADAVIIADFGLGLFTARTLARVCRAARDHAGVLAGDVSGKRSNLRSMVGMDLMCPSERELRDGIGMHDEGLPAAAARLLHETRSRCAIVTMGADGLVAFESPADQSQGWDRRLRGEHIPALVPFAVDPLGCGDALLTTSALALAAGSSLNSAAFLGAVAAGAQAQRLGNLPVSGADLRQGVTRVHSAHLAFTAAELIPARHPGLAGDLERAAAS